MKAAWKLLREEKGLETVEYAIITGLIVAGLVVVLGAIGAWVFGVFDGMATELGA